RGCIWLRRGPCPRKLSCSRRGRPTTRSGPLPARPTRPRPSPCGGGRPTGKGGAAMVVRAAWLLPGGSGPGQTREDTRLAPVGTRPGVIPGGDPCAATGAGAMTMQVGVGRAMVQGTTAQGAYPVAVTAPETLTFPDGDALNPRTDSVVLRVYDGLYDTSGDTLAVVERLPGTPAATPDPPALPVGCLRLWDVTVPAGASAGVGGLDWGTAVVDRRQYTAAVGGVIPAGGGLAFDGAYHG